MYTLVGLDANLNCRKGITDIGIYTQQRRYMIKGDNNDKNSGCLTRTLYNKVLRKLKSLSIKGPYLFVTWGGPEKGCLERHTSKDGNKVIDLEPIMNTLCHTSSLAKTSMKLGIGTKSEYQDPDYDAQLIYLAYTEMVRVTDNLKWVIDPCRLSCDAYLELHRELINSYISDNLISDKLVKLIYETVPRGLSTVELNGWYNSYRRAMLETRTNSRPNSHLHTAKRRYRHDKKILSPEIKLKDGTHVLKSDIELLKMKMQEDMRSSDYDIPRQMRHTIFAKDRMSQVYREMQEVSILV